MRKLSIAVFLVIAIATSATADNSFKSKEEVADWFTYYYLRPDPSKIPDAFIYMSQIGLMDSKNATPSLFGFLAGIFSQNPKDVPSLSKRLKVLEEKHLGILILGLWYANLPESQREVQSILEAHLDLRKHFAYLNEGSPVGLESIPLEQGPWVLDALWGNFVGTGSKIPVLRVASALPWVDVRGDTNRLLVGGAARWSLTSNAAQHKRVLDICETEARSQPEDVREKLQEVIAKAKEEAAKRHNK